MVILNVETAEVTHVPALAHVIHPKAIQWLPAENTDRDPAAQWCKTHYLPIAALAYLPEGNGVCVHFLEKSEYRSG